MPNFLRNWKTTVAGAAMILSIVPKATNPAAMTMQDFATVSAGIGLILAKDNDKSHAPEKLAEAQ